LLRKFAKQRRNVDVGVEIGPMKAGSASNNLDPRQLLGRADCNPCKSPEESRVGSRQ